MSFGRFIKDKKKYGLAFILSALVVVGLLFVCQPLFAQGGLTNLNTARQAAGVGGTELVPLIGRIIQVILGLLGVLAVILLIYAGFVWMTASGDPAKVIKAKKIITGTIIGLIIIFMSFAIVTFIISSLGDTTTGPGVPCDTAGESESCLTGDICEGERICGNSGYWGACVRFDSSCPGDPFYGKQFSYISGFSDPRFPDWDNFSSLSRGFVGTVQLPISDSLIISGYAHDRGSDINKMELHPEDVAATLFGNVSSINQLINGQLYYVVPAASTTWDTSGYAIKATTTVFIKAFNLIDENFESKNLRTRFWPAHCFNNIPDGDETDVDCGGSCPNCDGASCRRPDENTCDDGNCASGICLQSDCTCAKIPKISYISPATDTLGDTDFDHPTTTEDDIANGAPGSFITIWGRSFGTAPGRVIFREPVSGAQHQTIMYLGANCTGTWSNNQIITKVPEALTGGAAEKNLLTNSGFEDNFSVNDWYLVASGSGKFVSVTDPTVDYMSITTTAEGVTPPNGSGHMLRFDHYSTSSFIVLRYKNPITLEADKKYVFSGYVYMSDKANLPREFIDLWDNGRHSSSGTNEIDICQPSTVTSSCDNSDTSHVTSSWQRISLDFTVFASGSLKFYPRIIIGSGGVPGKIYFDDLQLEEVSSGSSVPTPYNPKEFQLGDYQVEVINTSTELTSNQRLFQVNNIERPGICNMVPPKGVFDSSTVIYGNKFPTLGTQEVWWQVYNRYFQVSSTGHIVSSTAVKEIITSTYANSWTDYSVIDVPPANKRGHSNVSVYNGTEHSNYFTFLISSGSVGDVCGYSNLTCDDDFTTCVGDLSCYYCDLSDPACDVSKLCTCQPPPVTCTPGVVSTTPVAGTVSLRQKATCTPDALIQNCSGFWTCNPAGTIYVCAPDKDDRDCPDYLARDNASQSIYSYAFTAVKNGGEGASCGFDAWGACDVTGCDKGFVCNVNGNNDEWLEIHNTAASSVSGSYNLRIYKNPYSGITGLRNYFNFLNLTKKAPVDLIGGSSGTFSGVHSTTQGMRLYGSSTDSHLNLTTPVKEISKEEGTISVWIYPTSKPSTTQQEIDFYGAASAWTVGHIFYACGDSWCTASDADGFGDEATIHINNTKDNEINFYYGGQNPPSSSTKYTLSSPVNSVVPGNWYNITAVYKNGEYIKLFINGNKVAENTNIDPITMNGNFNHIFAGRAFRSGWRYYKGDIRELAIYDRAITDEEAVNIFRGNSLGEYGNNGWGYNLSLNLGARSFQAIDATGTLDLPTDQAVMVLNTGAGDFVDSMVYSQSTIRAFAPQSIGRKEDGADTNRVDDWTVFGAPSKGGSNGQVGTIQASFNLIDGINEITLPNIPNNSPILAVIGNQLTGASNAAGADRIWKTVGAGYEYAWLHTSGQWYTGNNPTTLTLSAGETIKIELKGGHGPKTIKIPPNALTINEVSVGTPPCTCTLGQACKPGNIDKSTCQAINGCKQIKTCNANGYWDNCVLADPNCNAYPFYGNAAQSIFAWAFTANMANATDEPYVIESCNRTPDCNGDPVGSPSPWFEGVGVQEDSKDVGWTSTTNPSVQHEKACLDAVISARFNVKMFEPSFGDQNSSTIKILKCTTREGAGCTIVATSTYIWALKQNNNSIEKDILDIVPNSDLDSNKWYKVILQKGIVSDFNKPLRVNSSTIISRYCSGQGIVATDTIAYCWNFQTRSPILASYNIASNETKTIALPAIADSSTLEEIIGNQLTGSATAAYSDLVYDVGYTYYVWFDNVDSRWRRIDGQLSTTTYSVGDIIHIHIRNTNPGKIVNIYGASADGPLKCNIGCVECQPNPSTAWWYLYETAHRASPIADDNVCIALNAAKYTWDWVEKEYDRDPNNPDADAKAYNLNWRSPFDPGNPYATVTPTNVSNTTSTAYRETIFNNPDFVRISVTERESQRMGYCKLNIDFTNPRVMEDYACTKGTTQSPSPYKGTTDACINAMISARFSRDMKNSSIFSDTNEADYIGSTSTTIIIQRCDGENDVTSTALNALSNCDNVIFNNGFIFSYTYPNMTLEQMSAASTTVTSTDPEGFVINPNDGGGISGHTLEKDKWYRVIIRGGESGVHGTTGTVETAYGLLVTPGLTYDFNFSAPSDSNGDGELDYMWYFKTDNTDQLCPIDTVNVSPWLKFFRYVNQNYIYNAIPQAANCNILDGNSYSWAWRSLNELADDTQEDNPGSGTGIARICPTSSTAYLSCGISTTSMAKVFGVSEGLVNIKARASSTHKIGAAWDDAASGDKWGYGKLQIGYGNLMVTSYNPLTTVCQNPEISVGFNTDAATSTFSLDNNVKLYNCYEGLAYYPLNGNGQDNSGNNYHGTVSSTIFVGGKFGSALQSDGQTSRYVEVTSTAIKRTGDMTVSAWVRLDSQSGSGRIIASAYKYEASNRYGWYLGNGWGTGATPVADDDMEFRVQNGMASNFTAIINNFTARYGNKLVHVVGVYKPSQYVKLFINGQEVAKNTTAIPAAIVYDGGTNTRIGQRADNYNQGKWDGLIDEVRIYDSALTANQIKSLYDSNIDSCPFVSSTVGLAFNPYPTSKYARQFFMTTTSSLVPGNNYRMVLMDGANGVKAWNGKPLAGLNYKLNAKAPGGEECETSTYPWNTVKIGGTNACSSTLGHGCILDTALDFCNTQYSQCTTSTVGSAYCNPTCHNQGNNNPASCGNRLIEPGEECDDGNIDPEDGCAANCRAEGSLGGPDSVCGNGRIEVGELCDDLISISNGNCSGSCLFAAASSSLRKAGSTSSAPICGNAVVEKGESCDDGNTQSGDGCRGTESGAGCLFEGSSNTAVCGNGIVETGQYDSFSWTFRAGDRTCVPTQIILNPCTNGIWRFVFDSEIVSSTVMIYKKMDSSTVPLGSCESLTAQSKPANFFVAAINKIKDVVLRFLGIRKATAAMQWCPISKVVIGETPFNQMEHGFYYDKIQSIYTSGIAPANPMEIIGYTDSNDSSVVNYINGADWTNEGEYRVKVLSQNGFNVVRPAQSTIKITAGACEIKNIIADIWPRGETKDKDTFFCAGDNCGQNTADNDLATHNDEYDDDMSAQWTKVNSNYDLPSTSTTGYPLGNQHIYRLWALSGGSYLLKSTFTQQIINLAGTGVSSANLQVRDATTTYTGDFWITGGDKNGEDALAVTSTGVGSVTSTIFIRTFLCKNPWPDYNHFPFEDNNETSCNSGSGTCYKTNFLTYYCRDAGDPTTTTDDLPFLPTSTSNIVVKYGNTAFEACPNLPSDFIPRLGYYHAFSEGRMNLWDNQGNIYVQGSGGAWDNIAMGTMHSRGLPSNFRPVVGYYHQYGTDGRINLWDAGGRLYVGKYEICDFGAPCIMWYVSNDSRHGTLNSQTATAKLPNGFTPGVGYYSNAIYLWSGRDLYKGIGNFADGFPIDYSVVPRTLPANYYPIIGYYNIAQTRQEIWNSAGIRFINDADDGIIWITSTPSGLPTNFRPKVGYYDSVSSTNKKIVLWDGQRAYSSTNGTNFIEENYFNNNCDINIKEFFFSTSTSAGGYIGLGIKIVSNGNHYSPLYWYQTKFDKNRQGNPKEILINGYPGITEGRTAYVNAVNYSPASSSIHTNMYIMSYDQDLGTEAGNIFSQMVNNWEFNRGIAGTDISGLCFDGNTAGINPDFHCASDAACLRFSTSTQYYCNSDRAKLARDARRLGDVQDINSLMVKYYEQTRCSNDFLRLCNDSNQCYGGGSCGKFYPALKSGTYLIGKSYSVWPSWLSNLGNSLGTALPVDPINKFFGCAPAPSGATNSVTCWNEQNKSMQCPSNAYVYQYVDLYTMTRFSLKSEFDTSIGNTLWKPAWSKVNFLRSSPFQYYMTSTMCWNLPTCGNGRCDEEFGENSGNCPLLADGCASPGPTPAATLPPTCQLNGVVQAGEECDSGSLCDTNCNCLAHSSDDPSSNGCLCNVGYEKVGNACVCKVGYYWNGSACIICPSHGVCPGGTDTFTCPAPYVSNGTNCNSCGAGNYWNGSDCVVCPPAPAVCPGGTGTFTCLAPHVSNGTNCNSCVADNYWNATAADCFPCPINGSCPGGTDTFTCPAPYVLFGTTCNFCTADFYWDPATSVCLVCPVGGTCPGGTNTFTCDSGYEINATGDGCNCKEGWTCPAVGPAVCNPGNNCNTNSCLITAYGTFPTCTVCPANATCNGTASFTCNGGYYKNGTICSSCSSACTISSYEPSCLQDRVKTSSCVPPGWSCARQTCSYYPSCKTSAPSLLSNQYCGDGTQNGSEALDQGVGGYLCTDEAGTISDGWVVHLMPYSGDCSGTGAVEAFDDKAKTLDCNWRIGKNGINSDQDATRFTYHDPQADGIFSLQSWDNDSKWVSVDSDTGFNGCSVEELNVWAYGNRDFFLYDSGCNSISTAKYHQAIKIKSAFNGKFLQINSQGELKASADCAGGALLEFRNNVGNLR